MGFDRKSKTPDTFNFSLVAEEVLPVIMMTRLFFN
jgi:hypothetical protein